MTHQKKNKNLQYLEDLYDRISKKEIIQMYIQINYLKY